MSENEDEANTYPPSLTAGEWTKWFEDGHAPLRIAAMLTMNISPDTENEAELLEPTHWLHSLYLRRKLALLRNYGHIAMLPAIPKHANEEKGKYGKVVNLARVCEFALDRGWHDAAEMIWALAPELLDQLIEPTLAVSTAPASTNIESAASPGNTPHKQSAPSKADPHLLRTLGGMTLLLERLLQGGYGSPGVLLNNGKINMSAAAKEIEALLECVFGQDHSAIGRRISAGLDSIDGEVRKKARFDPSAKSSPTP